VDLDPPAMAVFLVVSLLLLLAPITLAARRILARR
jgi:hypothetical protein